MENLHFLHLTWDEVQRLTELVAENVNTSGFKPDLVVAISRGGFDPARIICDQLDVRRLASVQIESYEGLNKSKEPVVVLPVNADPMGKRVLIVDDVADSGSSLRKAKEYILALGASEVRIATLHIKPWSKFYPDYFAESVDAWVVYPWELRETILEIASQIIGSGVKGKAVVVKLVNAGFKKTDVDRYLRLEDV